VISNFVVQALRGEDITVYGDGTHTRSFCYVDDMVEGLVSVMDKGVVGPINLGNPEEVTIMELAGLVKEQTKSLSKITHRDLPADDPVRRCPDIGLAKKELGWSPKTGLKEGLIRTIEYFRSDMGG
jgi:UDP-glucuronate decarboxylase